MDRGVEQMEHLIALQTRLAHENDYLAKAKSDSERKLRKVWIAQIEKEIAREKDHLGVDVIDVDMSDDELLAELSA